jgi:hypothetical protein
MFHIVSKTTLTKGVNQATGLWKRIVIEKVQTVQRIYEVYIDRQILEIILK